MNRPSYFEGWFQKIYAVEHRASVLIIYGYATQNPPERFGFIQILLPNERPLLYYFPKHEVDLDLTNHVVRMGNNLLSTQEITIASEVLQMNLRLSVKHPVQSLKNTMGTNAAIWKRIGGHPSLKIIYGFMLLTRRILELVCCSHALPCIGWEEPSVNTLDISVSRELKWTSGN
jgi:hypothetical protein